METGTTQKPIIERVLFTAFLCLVFSLAFLRPSAFDLAGHPIPATDILFPAVAVLFLLSILFGARKLRWHKGYFYLGAYVAAFLFASAFSIDPERSIIKTASTIYLIGLAVLAFNVIDDERRLRITIIAWLAGGLFPVLIGMFTIVVFYAFPGHWILPFLTYHYGSVPVGNYPRLSSTFVSASMFCNYLNVHLLLLLIAHARKWIGSRSFWIYFALLMVCAIFTLSPGLGGVFLGTAIWFWYTKGNSNSRVPSIVFICGSVFALLLLLSSIIALQPHATAPYSLKVPVVGIEIFPSARLLVWTESLETFRDNFLTGNGPGSPSASVSFQRTDGNYSLLTDAHNSFLSVAAQTGVFGLIAVLALCVFVLRIGRQTNSSNRMQPIIFGLVLAFATAFVFQGLTGAFEDARHLWVLMGLILAADKINQTEDHIETELRD